MDFMHHHPFVSAYIVALVVYGFLALFLEIRDARTDREGERRDAIRKQALQAAIEKKP